jgi:O-methyltransferase involved in polyketide biosynthesis
MILSSNPDITFVESDLAVMLLQKQQLVHQVMDGSFGVMQSTNRTNHHFAAIDATDTLNSLSLDEYFQPYQPVTVLCEGLLMYLTLA